MRRTITKVFDTLKQAESFQDRLYDEYDHVRPVRSPWFGEAGVYSWYVSGAHESDSHSDSAPGA